MRPSKSRSLRFAAVALAAWVAAMDAASAQDAAREYRIAEQSLGQALREFALASNLDLLFSPHLVAGKKSSSLDGKFTVDEGLRTLLRGSGLEFSVSGSRVVISEPKIEPARQATSSSSGLQGANGYTRLAQADGDASQSSARATSAARIEETSRQRIELEEILVTGTHIRGVQPSSPMLTITEEEMRLSGHANLGDVIRALPQNFSGGQNPGIQFGLAAGDSRNSNATRGSSLNLRGLGPDATLTLLNGTRMPYDGSIQATDVANIPVAAIERMEVLLDGASAIYGSDAVGGVVNIILKRDYQGVELSARYGAASEGGYKQTQYTGVTGHTWGSGGFILTGDLSDNTAVRAEQRDYLDGMSFQEIDIYPALDQQSVLLSGHQELGGIVELRLDAFYSERESDIYVRTLAPSFFIGYSDGSLWGVSPSAQFRLPAEWSLRVHAVSGRNRNTTGTATFSATTGALTTPATLRCACNQTDEAGVEMEGPLFALSGGTARLSVGGGYRKNEFESFNRTTGVADVSASNRSNYGYGEVNLPLATRFALSGALRYESYENYGATTTPKIGATWEPVSGLNLKASWGKSFKTPTLNEQYRVPIATLTTLGGAQVLLSQGGNPNLDPEHAEIVTAGFVLQPQALRGFTLELGWFDIEYTDRITAPISPISQALTNPVFAPFVTLNPTPAQLDAVINAAGRFDNFTGAPYNPATVQALLHNQPTNVSVEHATGFDLDVRYRMELLSGTFSVRGSASWMESERGISTLAPELQMAGFSFFPPEFRGRLGANWSRAGVTLASTVNYIGGVENSTVLGVPKGRSMTTLDLVADYQVDSGPLGELGLNLAVINALNEDPPLMQRTSNLAVPYDSTNYSALGRIISATVTKKF